MADVKKNVRIIITVDDKTATALTAIETKFRGLDQKIFSALKWGALGVAGGLSLAVKEAANAEDSLNKVRAAAEINGVSWAKWGDEVVRETKRLQMFTRYSDEAFLDVLARMIAMTGNAAESLHNLGLVSDAAAAFQIDLGTAGDMVSRAMQGEMGRLGMLLPGLNRAVAALGEHSTAAQRSAVIMEWLGRAHGRATEDLKTFSGQLSRLKNLFGEWMEKLGNEFLPVLKQWGDRLATELIRPETIQKIEEFGKKAAEAFKNTVEGIVSLGKTIVQHGDAVLAFLAALTAVRTLSGILALGGALGSLAAGFTAAAAAAAAAAAVWAGTYAAMQQASPLEKRMIRGENLPVPAMSYEDEARIRARVAEGMAFMGPKFPSAAEWAAMGAAIPLPVTRKFRDTLKDAAGNAKTLADKLKELEFTTLEQINARLRTMREVLSSTTDPIVFKQATDEVGKLEGALDKANFSITHLFGTTTIDMIAKVRDFVSDVRKEVGGLTQDMAIGMGAVFYTGEKNRITEKEDETFRPWDVARQDFDKAGFDTATAKMERLRFLTQSWVSAFSSGMMSVFGRIRSMADLAALKIKDVFAALGLSILNMLMQIAAEMAALGLLALLFPSIGFAGFAKSLGGPVGAIFGTGSSGGRGGTLGGGPLLMPVPTQPGGTTIYVNVPIHTLVGTDEYARQVGKVIAKEIRYGMSPLGGV